MAKQVNESQREAAGYPWRAPVGLRMCCKPSLLCQERCPGQPWVINNCTKIPDMDCSMSVLPKESLRGGMEESFSVIPTCWADVQTPSVLQPWEHQGWVTALMLSTSHLALCWGPRWEQLHLQLQGRCWSVTSLYRSEVDRKVLLRKDFSKKQGKMI